MSLNIPHNPFVLVDGSSYLFRAYHAPPHLTNSRGEATGAIYGVVNMLRSLLTKYQPTHMAVVFDAKGPTFRNEMYAEYKAHRPPMPDDLRSQIETLHDIVRALGLPLLCIEGVEADDVIGTLARQAAAEGRFTLVSTGDKDMAQLVDEHVYLINTMSGDISDAAAVAAKFGVKPEQIIDYLAIMGDSSDNIPGLPKAGPKTAQGLLQGLGSIDNIYADPDAAASLSFRGAKTIPAKLREFEEQVRLSQQLATIKCDVELPQTPAQLTIEPADVEALKRLYGQCEFRSWLGELMKQGAASDRAHMPAKEAAARVEGLNETASGNTEFDRSSYRAITDKAEFEQYLEQLAGSDWVAFDTETTSLNYMEAELVGLSFATAPQQAVYIPVGHNYPGAPEQLDRAWVLAQLKPLLEGDKPQKVGQNLKYDAHILRRYNIRLGGIKSDTMLASYVYNSNGSRHDMDTLSLQYLQHQPIAFTEVAGKGAKQITFNDVALEQATPYAAEDADVTYRLQQVLAQRLSESPALERVLYELEVPLLSVLCDMEQRGVQINAQLLGKQSHELAMKLQQLEQKAYEIAGETFNLGSPKQLQTILFEKLQIPVVKKTPKGAPSTAEEVLQELALDYPLPAVIMEHRGLSKLKSTYTDKLPKMVNPRTHRIHTSYQQAVAATGRLSSTEPNLQNIPIRTEEGRRVRQAFTAPDGYQILAIDYSQIELRIMAHLSGDKQLLDAFAKGRDIHKATASEVFGVALDEVTSDQRRSAKAVNFGLIYGMSAFGLARQLDIPRHDAQTYMDKYFERFPGVLEYMERTRQQAKQQGYVETIYGRRLHLPEINAQNGARRKAAERAAINAPMQGSAADIIKRAMLAVADWIPQHTQAGDVYMIMQVHDELVFEVKKEQAQALAEQLAKVMESAAELAVPLVAEAGLGANWDEAH